MKFEVLTSLGFTVRTSEDYWQKKKIVGQHPDIAALLDQVKQALTSPSEVRSSSRDAGVLLSYLAQSEKKWVVAVVRRQNGDGFFITAYQTDAIKKGEVIWRR
ncbi:MAG: hypothetical protein BRC42_15125 [Cyanobacteria bacterium QS_1_48_34]|nr:MAG: hypothetical protein BRC42_15125 [Cyanobacteria bacterium QS_1_48_34]